MSYRNVCVRALPWCKHCSKLGTAITASLTFFTVVIYLHEKSNTYLLRSLHVQLYKQVTCASAFLSSNDSVIHDFAGSKVIYCCTKDTDYERPMKPFSIEVQNFWAWADKLDR